MTTAFVPQARRRVLADLVPGGLVRDVTLVLAGVALVSLLGQVGIPLPFTPVPLTLGTLAVLLTGAALGPVRATASLGLFLVLGMVGVPLFAQHESGWHLASFGYVIGYLLAAPLVGALARRGADRALGSTVALMVAGNLVIYACGVPWLMAYAHIGLGQGLALGVVPFLIGDAIKIVVATGLLPAAWKLVDRSS